MNVRMAAMTVLVGGMGWATEPVQNQPATSENQNQQEGVVEPKADAELHRMSDYLTGLKSLRATTTTVDEKVTSDGQKIQEVQQSKLAMKRPGELRVERVSPNGHAILVDNGKQFTAYNKEKNVFATAPAPDNLDAAIDDARARLQIDAPGGDLLVKDPYQSLIDGTVTGRYVGLEPIDGVMAHHLAFTRKDLDWQIWIKDGPEAAPLRYVITSKDMPGQPQFTLEIHDWKPNAPASAQDFTFTPPAGAKRIEFAPPKKAQR